VGEWMVHHDGWVYMYANRMIKWMGGGDGRGVEWSIAV
jgi:hypothetical protein